MNRNDANVQWAIKSAGWDALHRTGGDLSMTQYQTNCGNAQIVSRLSFEAMCSVLLAAVCATAASVFAVEAPAKPEVLTLQSFDDAAAIILRPNVDGGNPPAVEA